MFLDEDQFPFLEPLRRAWADIRADCLALADDSFEPWVQRQMYGEGWSVYGLMAFGTRIDAALAALTSAWSSRRETARSELAPKPATGRKAM